MTTSIHRSQPLPHPLARHVDRTPSPTPSHASSVFSQATSIDSLGEMPQIDKVRPMYDSSSSLENKMSQDWQTSNGSVGSEEEEGMEILLDEPSKKEIALKKVPEEKGGKLERKFPEEEDEEILKESNSRFVLFPIKYREVSSVLSRRKLMGRYGKRIKHPKLVSGRQKSWIWDMI
jgi:ribonucleoside-diphosphate reductase subunit M2